MSCQSHHHCDSLPFSEGYLAKWQRVLNVSEQVLDVPSSLLTRFASKFETMLVASAGKCNPFGAGDLNHWGGNSYCETVLKTAAPLEVVDALQEERWRDTPATLHNMVSYLGLPVRWPNGNLFGALCVLDSKARKHSDAHKGLLSEFRSQIEEDLAIMARHEAHIRDLSTANANLDRLASERQLILDHMPCLMAALTSDARHLAANRLYLDTFGETGVSIRGKHLRDLLTDAGWSIVAPFVERALHGETVHFEHSLPFATGPRYTQVSILPETNASGTVTSLYLFALDVHNRRMIEEHLRSSEKMRVIGQLAGGIAHDFNNMLGGITSAAEIISLRSRSALDPSSDKSLKMIFQTTQRASDLVSQLLSFARRGTVMRTVMDAHQIVHDTLGILRPTIDRNVAIICHLDARDSTIVGDAATFESALLNIGINAAHAMPGGGTFTISTRNLELPSPTDTPPVQLPPGRYLELSLADTGTGIPEEQLPRIFEPFFTTKPLDEGTGLGLAAVYGTVHELGGEISVESQIGHGTTFRILLPIAPTDPVPPSEGTSETDTTAGLILFVDDEDVIRTTGQIMIQELGYHAITARNGNEAVEIYRKRHQDIDLVIMDMNMPGISGAQAFAQMKEINPACHALISTGFLGTTSADALNQNGIVGVLRKPYRLADLSDMLTKLMPKTPPAVGHSQLSDPTRPISSGETRH